MLFRCYVARKKAASCGLSPVKSRHPNKGRKEQQKQAAEVLLWQSVARLRKNGTDWSEWRFLNQNLKLISIHRQ
jgi:hypothetical protein